MGWPLTVVAVGRQDAQATRSCVEHARALFTRRHISELLLPQTGCCDVAAPLAPRVLEELPVLGDGRRISWSRVAGHQSPSAPPQRALRQPLPGSSSNRLLIRHGGSFSGQGRATNENGLKGPHTLWRTMCVLTAKVWDAPPQSSSSGLRADDPNRSRP
jgi:hypothetical protein